MTQDSSTSDAGRSFPVWDVPVRFFHWALVALVGLSWATAEIGGNAMQVHVWSGLCILTLVLFRLLWGIFGSRHARFASFVRGPRAAWAYARALHRGRAPFFPGHNPLGGWMVLALLANLLLQAGTGLFSNDDVMLEGPLAGRVGKATSDLLTKVHHLSFDVLVVLIGVHIAAALFHLFVERENLIRPLLTGRKQLPPDEPMPPQARTSSWIALLLLALCAAAVWLALR